MAVIRTRKGEEILVDDADFEWLNAYTWHVSDGYARTATKSLDGKYRGVLMHRLITGADSGQKVDHENTVTLDNRRHNLRPCTHSQNLCNTRVRSDSATGLKGVSLPPRCIRYRAYISIGGKRSNLGMYNSAEDAARAYDAAAIEHFGEFAKTNKSMGLIA